MLKELTVGAVLTLLVIVLGSTVSAQSAEKHALIIANEDYVHGGSLGNPIKDSEVLAKTLTEAGFEVQVETNLGYLAMREVISEFGLKHSETDDVAMLYYSGHGAEFNGQNYLIPVDAKLEDARKARQEALTLSDVQNFLYREISEEDRAAGKNANGLNIIVLDACRNNPYPARSRSAARGLGEVEGASGTLIWYAAQPGARADDGEDIGLSPFAGSFVEAVQGSAGESVEETFKKMASLTLKATDGRQEPWMAGNILGRFSFRPDLAGGTTERSILAKYDPAQLDRPVEPFAPANPSETVVERFGKWNVGTFAMLGDRTYTDQPYDFEASRLFQTFKNKGPLLDVLSYGPYVWRSIDDVLVLGMSQTNDDNIVVRLFVTDIPNFFTDDLTGEPLTGALSFHRADGTISQIGDKPYYSFQFFCHDGLCGGSSQYSMGHYPRFAAVRFEEFLNSVSFLRITIPNHSELGVKAEFKEIDLSLSGLSEARSYLVRTNERSGESPSVRYPSKIDTFADILNDGELPDALGSVCGRFLSKYLVSQYYDHIRSCFRDESVPRIAFVSKVGLDYAPDFEALFTRSAQALSNPSKCPVRHCLDSDDPVGWISFFARAYRSVFADRVQDMPNSVRDAVAAAQKFEETLVAAHNTTLSEEDRIRLGDPETYYRSKLAMSQDLGTFKQHEFLDWLENYISQFPEGGGVFSHSELKGIVSGLNFEPGSDLPKAREAKYKAYLAISKTHEIRRLEQEAWSECAQVSTLSLAKASKCYEEFVGYFKDSPRVAEANRAIKNIVTQASCDAASRAWKIVSLSNSPSVLNAFIAEYGTCMEAELAKEKLSLNK